MLETARLNPILPVRDASRAEAFYRERLGLKQLSAPGEDPMAFEAGEGSMIVLTAIADRVPPDFPVVAFTVTAIEALVDSLAAGGVEFLEPSESSFRGVAGSVAGAITDYGPVKSAWLRDSEGNILAMNELVDLG